MGVGPGDFVKVDKPRQPDGYHGDVLKVSDIRHMYIPSLKTDGRVAMVECLLPTRGKDGSVGYENLNRFENWPIDHLVKVPPPKGLKVDKPEPPKDPPASDPK